MALPIGGGYYIINSAMKKLLIVTAIVLLGACKSRPVFTVDLFDENHKILELNVPVSNILEAFEKHDRPAYYVQEIIGGRIAECKYERRLQQYFKT